MGKIIDMTEVITPSGIKVLSFAGIKNRSAMWNCECFCGNKFITKGTDLRNNHTKSCGCVRKEKAANHLKQIDRIIDLTGQRFGKLTVIKDSGERASNRCVLWECKCDCGNIIKVSSDSLRNNNQKSCGCERSKGEYIIAQLLLQNNIPFETQKTFDKCRFSDTNALAKFDFYVNNQYLIEFDGIQHFDVRYGWNTEEYSSKTFRHDQYKNQWCKENNIPLIRIPYTHLPKLCLEDLLLDKSNFIL